jgi:hypothetical protein
MESEPTKRRSIISIILRAISFVYRFIVLFVIVAYLEGNRDA